MERPSRWNKAFESTIVERMLGSQIGGTLDMGYEPSGVAFRAKVPDRNHEQERWMC